MVCSVPCNKARFDNDGQPCQLSRQPLVANNASRVKTGALIGRQMTRSHHLIGCYNYVAQSPDMGPPL